MISVLIVCLIVKLTQPKADGQSDADYDGQSITDTDYDIDDNTQQDTGSDEITPEDISPVYAYIDLAYESDGSDADYLTDPIDIIGNGTYTVTINRSDNTETDLAFNGLSYMGIRLIDDENSDVDMKGTVIQDVKVKCDGVLLRIDETGSTQYDDGVIYDFFDCYDPDGSSETVYDFSDKKAIEISFTISGAQLKD